MHMGEAQVYGAMSNVRCASLPEARARDLGTFISVFTLHVHRVDRGPRLLTAVACTDTVTRQLRQVTY